MAELVNFIEYREKKELSRLMGELGEYLDDYDCPKFPDSIIKSLKICQEYLEQIHGDEVKAVLEWHNPQSK